LRLDGATVGGGFSALMKLTSLETLGLPDNWLDLPADEIAGIHALAKSPSLQRISEHPAGRDGSTLETAEQFWSNWDRDLAWIERLLRTDAKPKLKKLPDKSWDIDLHDGPTSDISALAGVRISRLDISTTLVKDLAPLQGAPIERLDLRKTPVENLEPLRGMPIRTLFLHQTQVIDFSPLSTLTELEFLDISVTSFSDLSLLHAPRLSEIRMGSTLVTDLSPLTKFPLQKIHCDSVKVATLAPLAEIPTLIWVIPPRNVPDVTLLRSLPNLKLISYSWNQGSIPTMTPEKFWQSPDVLALQQRFPR
jgi:Leucine-rich repeat (LRR) protein